MECADVVEETLATDFAQGQRFYAVVAWIFVCTSPLLAMHILLLHHDLMKGVLIQDLDHGTIMSSWFL